MKKTNLSVVLSPLTAWRQSYGSWWWWLRRTHNITNDKSFRTTK